MATHLYVGDSELHKGAARVARPFSLHNIVKSKKGWRGGGEGLAGQTNIRYDLIEGGSYAHRSHPQDRGLIMQT